MAERLLDPGSFDPGKKFKQNILDLRSLKTPETTESLSNYLVEKFGTSDYELLFLKVAWRLPDKRIHELVEASMKAKNPLAYFIRCVKREPGYR